ncbi:MAG: hypothetical protein LC667_20370, partial [Thioalkalivibrio sp.]|nr:hypothetical protein [Thioalkalivibrio sp.]
RRVVRPLPARHRVPRTKSLERPPKMLRGRAPNPPVFRLTLWRKKVAGPIVQMNRPLPTQS